MAPKNKDLSIDAPRDAEALHRIADPALLNKSLALTPERRIANRIREIHDLLWLPEDTTVEDRNLRLARAIELYESLAPTDGAEAMIAQQMVASHVAAMECLKRAALPNQSFEAVDMTLKHAQKLMALHAKQLETLNKHRGKGQQKVTVEHVNVEAGGQAIVGNVETGKSYSGGLPTKDEDP